MTTLETAEATTERYRRAGETGDVDLALSTFAEDAVLRSPLTDRVRFTGHAELRALIEVAYGRVDGIRFHTDVGDERTRVVVYTARIGGADLEEAALLRLDDRGRITEATLFIRPLPAQVAVMGAFGPDIARRNGRRGAAGLLAVLTRPLLAMVRSGDRYAVPLVRPKRGTGGG
jgi:SnoaL-like domain